MFKTLHVFIVFLILICIGCSSANQKTSPAQKTIPSTSRTPPSGFVFYGNWCGPGRPKDIHNVPDPTDHLNAACMRHDKCYVEEGYFECKCDATLVSEIDNSLLQGRYKHQTLVAARGIKAHFLVSPCEGDVSEKMMPTRVLTNIYQGVKRKIKGFYDKFIGDGEPQNGESLPPND